MSAPLPLFAEGVLRATVPLMEMETVYLRYGDWFAWLALAHDADHGGGGRGQRVQKTGRFVNLSVRHNQEAGAVRARAGLKPAPTS